MDTDWRGRMIAPLVAMPFLTADGRAVADLRVGFAGRSRFDRRKSGVIASSLSECGISRRSRRRLTPPILARIYMRPESSFRTA